MSLSCSSTGTHPALVSGGPTSYTIAPTSEFIGGETCTLTVYAADVTDQDTNDPPNSMASDFTMSFTTDDSPTVSATPANGDTDVAVGSDITVTFSEPVSVDAGWFSVGCTLSGIHTVTYSGGPTDFTVNPDSNFASGENCTMAIYAASIHDVDSYDPPDGMHSEFNASFTTAATADDAPSVSSTTPIDGYTVTANSNLTVDFSEAVNAAAGWFDLTCSSSGAHMATISGGPTSFTVNPNTDFEPGEACTLTLYAANITDQDSNDPPDTLVSDYTVTFDVDVTPAVTATSPVDGATGVLVGSDINITFDENVDVTGDWFQIACGSDVRTVSATNVTGGPTTFTITPNSALPYGTACTVTVYAARVTDQDTYDPPDSMAANYSFGFTTEVNICTQPYTAAYSIQGSGMTTPMNGSVVTTMGVVVGDFELPTGSGQIRGFFVQDQTGDGDLATSDGVFVYNGGTNSVNLGDVVRVTGTVGEYNGQTQISSVSSIIACGTDSVDPTDISLPFSNTAEMEQYEGMLVRIPETLYVTEIYQLGRFGQVTLSGDGKLPQPTGIVAPGAAAAAEQAANDLNKIIIDDANNSQNVDPIVFGRGGLPLSASNTLRGGDTITGLVGVFNYTWGGHADSPNAYRIRPVNALDGYWDFAAVNARPTEVPDVGGNNVVVGMNLLNYFNTFDGLPDTVDNCILGVGGGSTDCRGADDAAEFLRQSDKTVAAMLEMDADVYGIVEMENDGYGATSAIQDLVNKLNAATTPGQFAFIDVDIATGQVNALGTDAIKVGLIYQPARVTPVGQTAVLNSTDFVNGGDTSARNRPSLLQAFENTDGGIFLVNVNHLKSKGSACDDADTGDGQGECSIVRTNAVNELLDWYATDPTGTGDSDILVVGDLNSYAMEDPITAFTDAGFTNMIEAFGGSDAYSYVYDGQWGYLDYAIASPSLYAQTNDVADFHINSDEPSVLDYNTNYKSAGQIISLYNADMYRISDHDPVIVGLDLVNESPAVSDVTKLGTEDTDVTFVAGDFMAAFSDPEDASLDSIAITSLPAHGTLYDGATAITGGMLPYEFAAANIPNLVYAPTADFNGADSFGWNGTDGFSYALTGANVNITLDAVNDAPSFTSTPVTSVMQDVLYTYNITTSDDDGDPLTITAPTRPVWLITFVDHHDGTATLSGLPHGDDVGPNSVTLNVSDGNANVDQSFVINVGDTNDTPIPDPANWSLPENSPNGTVVGTVTYNDPDVGQTHTFGIDFGNTGNAFALDVNTGVVTVNDTTKLDYETLASYTLGVHVTDNGIPPMTGAGPIFINLTDVNEGTTIGIAGAPTISQDLPITITLPAAAITVADPDSNPIQITLTMTNGTLDLSTVAGLNFACAGCVGDGTGDATMTFQGSVANINSSLDNSVFHPTAGYTGPAAVTVLVDDLEGATTGPSSLAITVAAAPHVVLGANTSPQDGAMLQGGISVLTIQFNMDVLHGAPGNPNSADNPANYILVGQGTNGFHTNSCGGMGGGVQPDDVPYIVNNVTYDAATFTATLNVNNGAVLPDGIYRLFVCGTTSITDPSGVYELNSGLSDTTIDFTIVTPAIAAVSLPSTGFAPDRVTVLPEQTVAYAESDLWLEIPKLGVQMDIVGVPLANGEWDVSWLGKQAGWLEGSAYPTWDGNSVLTGHVWNADNTAGPFRYINTLWYGDEIIVHAGGADYVYSVRSVQQVGPGSTAQLLKHEDLPWVTLVTCRGYDPATGEYKYRVLVRAVLVDVK